MTIKVLWQMVIVLLTLWSDTGFAYAHALVIESSPKDGEVLTSAPREVALRFNEKIEKSLARFSLTTGNGRIIRLPEQTKKYGSEAPERLVIQLPDLEPDNYILRYKILSTDGHATSGVLRFRVVGTP
ncbi:MAG TPA: copper resistance CopC family protein [Thermodesulfovibrionales bacterium]|nr:copper resistance CopC family protein [Thermodesulfovibrionales bacterium]